MTNFEPRPFGKYFLTDRIAVGGMAEIYKAKTFGVDGFEKVLAIKKILPHCSQDKEFTTMLTDEAKLVVQLSHANIVQVYDLGLVGDDYFISMEFIDGINVRDLVLRSKDRNEPIPEEICIYIISEICKGLDYAHNKKDSQGNPLEIVHRDVSPHNILVSYEGGVKIVDFGIAKAAQNLSQTHVGILKGKVTYMSPEQALGKPIDRRTDLYSLGIVFYELLTNKRLFTGESQLEVLKKIRETRITEESLQDISEPIRTILAKALAYNINERYQSAADFQLDLTRALYTHYPSFAPKQLIELLEEWFLSNVKTKKTSEKKKLNGPEPGQQTILVSSTQLKKEAEQESVFQDKSQTKTKVSDENKSQGPAFATQQIEIEVSKDQKSEKDKDEVTEKSDITTPKALLLKQRAFPIATQSIVAAIVIVVLFLGLSVYKDDILKLFSQGDDPNVKKIVEVVTKDILVVSSPEGADVKLNGTLLQKKTPVLIEDLKIGEQYVISFSKEGYLDTEQLLVVEKDLSGPFKVDLEKAPDPTYDLKIVSKPSGAKIFIDGKDSGLQTPDTIENLKVGERYKVSLEKDDYESLDKLYTNSQKKDQVIDIELKPIPYGTVVIQSNPKDVVLNINGKVEESQIPVILNKQKIGTKVKVIASKDGYFEEEKEVSVTEAKEFVISFDLKKIPPPKTVVTISTKVKGTKVYIDGKNVGNAPFKTEMEAGVYEIVLKRTGYETLTKEITIKEGEKTLDVNLDLKKIVVEQKQTNHHQTNQTKQTQQNSQQQSDSKKQSSSNVNVTGSLRIDSSPRGAAIKLNGAPKGITPFVVSGLPKNKPITITVTKSGYRSWSRTVTLTRDKTELKAILVSQ